MTGAHDQAPESQPLIGQMVEVWGRLVHYHRVGTGHPVLLLHGNGSLGEEIWRSVAPERGISWIAPDRPGYGFSAALPPDRYGPTGGADWAAAFASALGIGRMVVAAHSLGCASALCLAARHRDRVEGLVLLSPFCRPTPHRWMLGLRAAVMPGIGPLIRHLILPLALPMFRTRILQAMNAPNKVPATLLDFPVSHAAQPQAVLTTAAELRQFNAGMRRSFAGTRLSLPVVTVFGAEDQTSDPDWHLPWLRRHVANLDCRVLPGVGHALHHARPGIVAEAVRSVIEAGAPTAGVHGSDAPMRHRPAGE
ncbi:MAG: alpha/beta hydrolase [Gemmobacter sp.]|nr:alpha/beta hydrolase [Gemmobacter sp.]